jgi:PhnB protein
VPPASTTCWTASSTSSHLAVDDAAQAIEFYKLAFGAKERGRVPTPDGKVAHAELEIGSPTTGLEGNQCRRSRFPTATTPSISQHSLRTSVPD